MTPKTPSKNDDPDAADSWLPDPKDVIEEIEVHPPAGEPFTIQRTNIVDPYDEPLPPAPVTPEKKPPRKDRR